MYYIEEGLGRSYRPLAMMFSISGLLGCIVFFQANQLSQIIRDYFYVPMQLFQDDPYMGNLMTGIIVASVVGTVIFGGIKRIAKVASRMVPTMVGLYIIAAILILMNNINDVPGILMLIMEDAFTGNAVSGGALGSMIIIGVRRGMFSNEAGTGTETMAHGAAKTTEPVREGLVAMLGPFIDTLVVCSITAFIILLSGVYVEDLNGVSMTAEAFKRELGIPGQIFLTIAVLNFALSTMFGYSYYGQKCASYVFGTRWKDIYNWFYVVMIVVASVASIDIAVNFVDSAYALMVIPTMTATFLLSPKVLAEAKRYFSSM
jgi:AGCS family alanine or glycine:cation symporter